MTNRAGKNIEIDPIRRRGAGLQEIARALNISPSLVSKVLNNRLGTSGASEATIAAITAKARELNYQKNTSGTALVTGRQQAIGVFIHHHGEKGSGVTSNLVEGIAEEASLQQQRLLLQFYQTIDEIRTVMHRAHRNTVDGLLLGGVQHPEVVAELRSMHPALPVVTVHDIQIHPQVFNIGMDQVEVGRVATNHLLRGGCRHIAHIKTQAPRYEGYRRALADAGAEFNPKLVFAAQDYSYAAGLLAVQQWLGSGTKFDAVFAESDQQAVAVETALLAAGRKPGQDVKLIGVDNAPFCEMVPVPVSSVSQQDHLRGMLGVRVLMNLINERAVEPVLIQPEIFVRDSSR